MNDTGEKTSPRIFQSFCWQIKQPGADGTVVVAAPCGCQDVQKNLPRETRGFLFNRNPEVFFGKVPSKSGMTKKKLLMVQKSGEGPGMCIKPCKWWGKLPTSTGAGVTEFWTINSITGERNKFTYQLLGCWASHQQYGHLVSLVVWGSIPMPSNMPRNLTCLLKRDYFNRKYIFQPLILIGHVSFPGGITRKKIVIVEPLSLF